MVVSRETKDNWGEMSLCIGCDRTQYGKFKRSEMANMTVELANCHGREGVLGILLKKKMSS